MIHLPEVSTGPGYLGTQQVRPYRFEGNKVVLSGGSAKEEPDVVTWRVVWEGQIVHVAELGFPGSSGCNVLLSRSSERCEAQVVPEEFGVGGIGLQNGPDCRT